MKTDKTDIVVYISLVLIALVLFWGAFTVMNTFERSAKAQCSLILINEGLKNYDYYMLCNNQACKDYFELRMKLYISASQECLK